MKFEEFKDPNELKNYLMQVLSRTGNNSINSKMLYHYTNESVVKNIIESSYIWLGTSEVMNDKIEKELVSSMMNRYLYFMSFSRSEENLAMYKMYAAPPNGVMMSFSYATAKNILDNYRNKLQFNIVRDDKVTDDVVDGELYWAEVCYKDLHSDRLCVGRKYNDNIANPLNQDSLCGFVKLDGWSYENEVRLCVALSNRLSKEERIAIRLSEDTMKRITIVKSPGFDSDKYSDTLAFIKRSGIVINESNYEGLVDFKEINNNADDIDRLRTRVIELEHIISKSQGVIMNSDKVLYDKIVKIYDSIKYYLTDFDFSNDYEKDTFDKLYRFLLEADSPQNEFVNEEIEKTRQNLIKVSVRFFRYLTTHTFLRGNRFVSHCYLAEYNLIKSDSEDDQRYEAEADKMNHLADDVWEKYKELVRKYRKIIGG